MADRGPNPRELKRQMRQFGGHGAPDLLVAQGPATERLAPVSLGGNSSGFGPHELFSYNSHSSASFDISPMQQQTQQEQQPQGLSATAAPQLHPLFGGEWGPVYVPPGPVKEPSLVQNSRVATPLEQPYQFEDLDMTQHFGDAFTVAPQTTQGTVTNYLGSGTANNYPQPITSNLTPQVGVESSTSVQLSPIQQPYPQNELGAATGAPPAASFPESQWTNNPNLHQPEYSLVSSAPNFQLQSQSSINGLGYNPQLSPGLGYNPNLQLQSQPSNGLAYNPTLESQTQLSTGLGYNPNLQPQSQSSSGLGYNFNFQPSQSSNGLGYNPITLDSSQSQSSISLGQNHNLQQQSQSSNGLGHPNLEPQSQLSAGLWHNSNIQPESQSSNLELQSQISTAQGHNSNLQPQSQSSSGLGYDSNLQLQSQISTNCLGHNPNLHSQFQSSNGQGYNPNLQPQAQISNFLGYNSNVQPQPQSTNGPEYNPNLQPQSQLSTGLVYCDPNVRQSSTRMGVSQEITQSSGLSGSYLAGWPSNYQNQSPNIEQQGLLVMQPTPNLQPHEIVRSSSNVVITATLQDRNNQQLAPFHMGTSFPSQAAQGFENLQPQAPRRFVPSQIYDSSFEEMGLPIDPHLRLFRRRNL